MAGADYYTQFPLGLPDDPAVWRLKHAMGLGAACIYYETRAACAQAYNNRRSLTVDDLPGMAWKNHMEPGELLKVFDEMARCGLIERAAWMEGTVQIADVVARQEFLFKKAEAGRIGGKRGRSKGSGGEEDVSTCL